MDTTTVQVWGRDSVQFSYNELMLDVNQYGFGLLHLDEKLLRKPALDQQGNPFDNLIIASSRGIFL
jgi:hypothetical protein